MKKRSDTFIDFPKKQIDLPYMIIDLPPYLLPHAEIMEIGDLFTRDYSADHIIYGFEDREIALAMYFMEYVLDVEFTDYYLDEILENSPYPPEMTAGELYGQFPVEDILTFHFMINYAVNTVTLEKKKYKQLIVDFDVKEMNVRGSAVKRKKNDRLYLLLGVCAKLEMQLAVSVFKKNADIYRVWYAVHDVVEMVPEETRLHVRAGAWFYDFEVVDILEEFEDTYTITAELTDSLLARIQSLEERNWKSLNARKDAAAIQFKPESWEDEEEYTHVVVREKTGKDLFGHVYSYEVFVTNLQEKNVKKMISRHKRPKSVERFINERFDVLSMQGNT